MSILTPFLLGLIPMISWGVMDFLYGILGRKTKATVVLFGTQFIGLIFIALLIPVFELQTKDWLLLIALGILPVFSWLFYLKASSIGEISIAGPVSRTNFVFASILGILFLNESITFLKVVGIVIVLAGGILLSLKRDTDSSHNKRITTGGMLAALSAIVSGLLLFFLATFSRGSGWYATTLFLRLGVTIFAFFTLIPNRSFKDMASTKIPWLLMSVVALADIIGLSAYNIAVSKYAVSYVSVIASSAPLVIILLARTYLKEKLATTQYAGALLILLGIVALAFQF